MLSLQGTVRNTGDPVITIAGHNGGSARGKTEARCLKGNRESDHLILVKNRRSNDWESSEYEVGERRG